MSRDGTVSAVAGGHVRWEQTGADEHAVAGEEARASLLLGQMVHDRRTELGLTQAELAERAGMTQPQLSRLESGGATPTVPLPTRLAAALEADLVRVSRHSRCEWARIGGSVLVSACWQRSGSL